MNQFTHTSAIDRLQQVRDSIHTFEARYGRVEGSVQLLAVSKRKPVAVIQEAASLGQQHFGENYPSEAVEKIQALNKLDLIWHFIGGLQSRKATVVAEHFDWVHSVDRLKVASRLSATRATMSEPLNICLQVNLDAEQNKSGIEPAAVEELAGQCVSLPGLRLRGLMAIPAIRENLTEQRKTFARLKNLLDSLKPSYPELDTLSMGMSADLEAAIAEGATIVRVGTAIFGARDS